MPPGNNETVLLKFDRDIQKVIKFCAFPVKEEGLMLTGIQYFRDPNPAEELWEKDLHDIAVAGFGFIGCWVPWRYVNPADGHWEFEKYGRLLRLAEKNGLKVRIQLVPESAPDWVVRKHPDSLMVNEAGQSVYLHPHPMLQLGGWPGLNANHPEIRLLINGYYTQVVRNLKDFHAVMVWSIWNEIQFPFLSYDPYTQQVFRSWIKKQYPAIEEYNRAHSVQFADYSEVLIPKNALEEGAMIYQRAAEIKEFTHYMIREEAALRASLVRKEDPARPVSIHTNTCTPFDASRDSWETGDAVDITGDSQYWNEPFHDTMSCLKQRSVKGPGKWWMVEHSAGRLVYFYGNYTYPGDVLVYDAIRALGYGAGAVSFWQYRCETTGQEAPNFGLLNQDGTLSERYRKLAAMAGRMKDWDASLLDYPDPQTALLVEPIDMVFRSQSESWMKQVRHECDEWERWLEALLYAGQAPCFIPARRLHAEGIPSSVKVLFAPCLAVLREGVAETLARWVESGGHLVAGPFTGVYRMDGRTYVPSPGGALRELFGLHVRDRISGERFNLSAPQKTGTVLSGAHLFELIEPASGTKTLLSYGKNPAVLTHRYGKGTATYIATFPGVHNSGCRSPLSLWLKKMVEEDAGIVPSAEINGPVWFTTARRDGRDIFFVQNPDKKRNVRAVFSMGVNAVLEDIVSKEIFRGKKSLTVPLKPRQVRMLAALEPEASSEKRKIAKKIK